jgi:hypothetical protein
LSDYLQRSMPEFDEEEFRTRLASFSKDQLVDMLIDGYKTTRLFVKLYDESRGKLQQIDSIVQSPTKLSQMPDVPGPDNLRKMWER